MLIYLFAGFVNFTWSDTINVSKNPGHSAIEPAITLDSTGRYWVVWAEDWQGGPTKMMYAYDDGDGWSEPYKFASIEGEMMANNLCTDKSGTVHWVFGFGNLYWCMYKDGKWTKPETLTDKIIERGVLTATPDGRVYAVYYTYFGVVYYRVYENETWGEEHQLIRDAWRLPFAITWDVKSRVHMILWNTDNGQLDYTVYDTLHGWSAYEQVSDFLPDTTEGGYVGDGDICTDRDGNPHIVFTPAGRFDYYLTYRYYDGKKWSKLINLDQYKVAHIGDIHIVRDFKRRIIHIIWVGSSKEDTRGCRGIEYLQVDEHINTRYKRVYIGCEDAKKYLAPVLSPDGYYDVVFVMDRDENYHFREDVYHITTRSVGIEEEGVNGISIDVFKDSIVLELNREEYVQAELYDNKGSKIEVLYTGSMLKGRHIIGFDRSTLSQGIYFLRITHNGKSETKKVIVVE